MFNEAEFIKQIRIASKALAAAGIVSIEMRLDDKRFDMEYLCIGFGKDFGEDGDKYPNNTISALLDTFAEHVEAEVG